MVPSHKLTEAEIGVIQLESGLTPYSLTLPASALAEAPQRFEFRYAWSAIPAEVIGGSADLCDLAVAWYSIQFSDPTP